MAIAFQRSGDPVKDGNVYFLRPEGNPTSLVTSLEGRANLVSNVDTNVVGTSLDFRHLSMGISEMLPMSASDTNISAANVDAVITLSAAGVGRNHTISGVSFSYSGVPTAGSFFQIQSGGSVVFKQYVSTAGINSVLFDEMKVGSENSAVVLTLSAGGIGIIGIVSIMGRRIG